MKNLKQNSILVMILIIITITSCEKENVIKNEQPIELKATKKLNGGLSDVGDSTATQMIESQQVSENNDISYVGSDNELGIQIEEIAKLLRTYKKTNPTATNREVDLYAEKIINSTPIKENFKNARVLYTDLDDYFYNKLNPQELALYNSNKSKAILCIANGVFANNYSKSNYIDNVLLNGNGDAFRHALWNFGMTIDVGKTFTKTWSDAHEYGNTTQPNIQRTMDLYNNKIGIQLGVDNPNTYFHSTFISKTKEKVRGGKLYIIINNKLYWSDSYGEK